MFILKSYLNSKFYWRFLGDAMLLGIYALFLWQGGYDFLLPFAIGVGAIILLETFVFMRRFIIPALLTLVYVILFSYLSYTAYTLLVNNGLQASTDAAVYTTIGLLTGFGALALILALCGGYFFAKGKLWINLVLCYLAYFVGFIVTGAILPEMSPALWSLAGVILLAIVLTLRIIFPRIKPIYFNWGLIANNKQASSVQGKIKNLLTNENLEKGNMVSVFSDDVSNRIFFVRTSYALSAILPLSPEKSLGLRKNKLTYDDKDVSDMLDAFMNVISDYSRQHKIPVKYITPIVYINNNNQLGTDIAQLSVARRQQPERILGSVYLVSPKGFVALLNRFKNNGKKLPNSVISLLT